MERVKAEQGYRRKQSTPAYYADMYLLTASEDLCRRTANCFLGHSIEFGYTDSFDTIVSDLSSTKAVDTLAFSLAEYCARIVGLLSVKIADLSRAVERLSGYRQNTIREIKNG